MAVFLDANAFYHYYGRDKLPGMATDMQVDIQKLRSVLDSEAEKYLVSSAFIEIVTRFHNNVKIVLDIIAFISNKRILIANVTQYQDLYIDSNELSPFVQAEEATKKQYIDKLISNKIDAEARFLVLFVLTILFMYLNYKVDMLSMISNEKREQLKEYLATQCSSKDIINKLVSEYKQNLQDGYSDSTAAKVAKEIFIQTLSDECFYISWICFSLRDIETNSNEDIDGWISSLLGSGIMSEDKGTVMKSLSSELSNLQSNTAWFDQATTFLKQKGLSHCQAEYLKQVMFPAWIDRSQVIRKNDIFDMFVVGALDWDPTVPSNGILLTFDTTIRKFLNDNGYVQCEIYAGQF